MPRPPTCHVDRVGFTSYDDGLERQQRCIIDCREHASTHLLLLEHPPTYTLGARGNEEHLLVDEARLAQLGAVVRRTNRGGDITFHGPGQLVGYPILDLKQWGQGPRWYVRSLEQVLIDTLTTFDIQGRRSERRPGVWIGDSKIASIGVRISRGVTSHGFALNVDPDLEYFSHIVPCGLPGVTVTSMAQVLGVAPTLENVMNEVSAAFGHVFMLQMRAREAEEALVG